MAAQTVAKAPYGMLSIRIHNYSLWDVVYGKAAKLGFRAHPILSINANPVSHWWIVFRYNLAIAQLFVNCLCCCFNAKSIQIYLVFISA